MSKRVAKMLDDHRQEGAALQEGAFSISAEEALRKVTTFGLESPEKGLLRLVQSAVAEHSQQIEIQLLRESVQLKFKLFESGTLSIRELPEQLRLEQNNLGLALLSCLHSGFLRGWVGDSNSCWSFTRTGFQSIASKVKASRTVQIELVRDAPEEFWSQLKSLLKSRCFDHKLLSERLLHCPASVQLDGRCIGPTRLHKFLYELSIEGPNEAILQGVKSAGWPRTRYLLEGETRKRTEGEWDVFELARVGARLELFTDRSGTFSVQKTRDNHALFARLWIPMQSNRSGRIAFVKDGVVVGKLVPDYSLPLSGVVSAHNLDLDISGLELVHNDKVEKMMKYIYALFDRRLRQLGREPTSRQVQRILDSGGF